MVRASEPRLGSPRDHAGNLIIESGTRWGIERKTHAWQAPGGGVGRVVRETNSFPSGPNRLAQFRTCPLSSGFA
jgi:hypothetical protein